MDSHKPVNEMKITSNEDPDNKLSGSGEGAFNPTNASVFPSVMTDRSPIKFIGIFVILKQKQK